MDWANSFRRTTDDPPEGPATADGGVRRRLEGNARFIREAVPDLPAPSTGPSADAGALAPFPSAAAVLVGIALASVLFVKNLSDARPSALGIEARLIYCLLFGALSLPTDPIAVLGLLKRLGAPKRLEVRIAGESLFNDGVGVVVFLALLGVATGAEAVSAAHVAGLFLKGAVGGAAPAASAARECVCCDRSCPCRCLTGNAGTFKWVESGDQGLKAVFLRRRSAAGDDLEVGR